jgi:hypothetical protein
VHHAGLKILALNDGTVTTLKSLTLPESYTEVYGHRTRCLESGSQILGEGHTGNPGWLLGNSEAEKRALFICNKRKHGA